MHDAIVMSTWSWDTFNVPERISLALALRGVRVLYCETPVSRFRGRGTALHEIHKGIYGFGPEYFGGKLNYIPLIQDWQWRIIAQQILRHTKALQLKDPIFIFSHIDRMTPLCHAMKTAGFPLVHICMDYPEPYQYELITLSDKTLVIPKAVFHKLKSKFGEKIQLIPQSIHLPTLEVSPGAHPVGRVMLADLPRPRLGYLGPMAARVNMRLLREVLLAHSEWQFIHFGGAEDLRLPNAHSVEWSPPEKLQSFIASLDVGVMPYDCFEEKNLHCVPLKLFDYFLAGLPVVATPLISLWRFSNLIYFGDTADEFSDAISLALRESKTSPKCGLRKEVAREYSTDSLGRLLQELLSFGKADRE
jgi:glycosyltransferase involved in cell wall biosynthesis